jgi:hypothetical protein
MEVAFSDSFRKVFQKKTKRAVFTDIGTHDEVY